MVNSKEKEKNIFRSGLVAIIGKPNAGKSTFVNFASGTKVAITSPKPQTTRHKIMGVRTDENCQIIFVDTPGVVKIENELDSFMEKIYKEEIIDADLVLFMTDSSVDVSKDDLKAMSLLKKAFSNNIPVFLILNKCDKNVGDKYFESYKSLGKFTGVYEISASKGTGIDKLINDISMLLPEGPMYFPPETHTDQSPLLFAAEAVRESILKLTSDEIPHGVFVHTEEMRDGKSEGTIYFQINIYVERASHKGIIIGKNGEMLKKIGSMARKEISSVLNKNIYLDLWVKVKEKWKNRRDLLRSWGYE